MKRDLNLILFTFRIPEVISDQDFTFVTNNTSVLIRVQHRMRIDSESLIGSDLPTSRKVQEPLSSWNTAVHTNDRHPPVTSTSNSKSRKKQGL